MPDLKPYNYFASCAWKAWGTLR